MNKTRWNILYAGLDFKTFFLLKQEKDFNLVGVAYIDKFDIFSVNPINYLFKAIYFLRFKNKIYPLEFILNQIWYILMPLSSGVFYKYRKYLYYMSISRSEVIDFTDTEQVVFFIKNKIIDVILVSVWPLLPEKIISAPKYGSVNIHPSLLPRYRGALPTLWSLKNHDKESAVTYMIINGNMDTGNIIAQHFFPITNNDDSLSLENKIASVIEDTFISDVKNYLLGQLKTTTQNKDILFSKTETYEKYRKIYPASENYLDVYNKINLYPFLDPGVYCYCSLSNRDVSFKKASFAKEYFVSKFTFLTNGEFVVYGLILFVKHTDGILEFTLFKDVDFFSSFRFLYIRRGKLS